MDVMTALASISKSVEFAKTLNSIQVEMNVAEMKARSADLLSNLADVKIALVEARDELDKRNKEISRLQAAFQIKSVCVRRNEMLYAVDETGEPIGRPFCPRCEQIDAVLIKLIEDRDGGLIHMICPQCKTKFKHAQTFQPTKMFNENSIQR